MSIKEKTIQKIESKIEDIEGYIEEKGIGSSQLSRVNKFQRDINLGLVIGSLIGVAGISTWLMIRD